MCVWVRRHRASTYSCTYRTYVSRQTKYKTSAQCSFGLRRQKHTMNTQHTMILLAVKKRFSAGDSLSVFLQSKFFGKVYFHFAEIIHRIDRTHVQLQDDDIRHIKYEWDPVFAYKNSRRIENDIFCYEWKRESDFIVVSFATRKIEETVGNGLGARKRNSEKVKTKLCSTSTRCRYGNSSFVEFDFFLVHSFFRCCYCFRYTPQQHRAQQEWILSAVVLNQVDWFFTVRESIWIAIEVPKAIFLHFIKIASLRLMPLVIHIYANS